MTLQELYNDKETLDTIKAYLVEFIKEKGIDKMFKHEPTEAIGEAKDLIDDAFDNLDLQFGSKREKKEKKVINEAR